MNSIFFPRLGREQLDKLDAASISFYEFSMGDTDGVIIQEDLVPKALSLLGVEIKSKEQSAYEGVLFAILKSRDIKPASDNAQLSAGTWSGKNQDGVLRVVEQVLAPYIDKEIHVSAPRKAFEPVDDGRFHVYVFASRGHKGSNRGSPDRIWGVQCDAAGDGAWQVPSSGVAREGSVFIKDGDCVVGELVGENALYIHHNLVKTGSREEEMILAIFLQHALSLLHAKQPMPVEQAREYFIDELSATAVQALGRQDGKSIEELQAEIRELKNRMKAAVRAAAKEEHHLYSNKQISADEILGAEFDALLKVPKVTDVQVIDGEIQVFTDVLFARDPRNGKVHEIGRFRIHLSPQRQEPLWFNLDRLVMSFAEKPMQGVHMFNSGKACLGNTAAVFASLFKQRQWDFAAQIAIEFAESVNQAGNDRAGLEVHKWPAATAEAIAARDERILQRQQISSSEHEEHRQLYIKACSARVKSIIEETLAEIANLRKLVEDSQHELVLALRARSLKQKINARKRIVERKQLAKEFEALLQVSKIKGVTVEPGIVSVFTDNLECKVSGNSSGSDQCSHAIGSFMIKIYLDGRNDCVRWFNLDKVENAFFDKQQAPMVLASGRACYSDLRDSFPELIADSRISLVAQLAIDFIESIDSDAAQSAFVGKWSQTATS